jgi:hypothetical protein
MSTDRNRNLQAEQATLGCILIDETLIDQIDTRPSEFSLLKHKLVYEAMLDLHDQDRPIDMITLQEMLAHRKQLHKVGGLPFLSQLSLDVKSAYNIHEYARILRDAWIRRTALNIAEDLSNSAFHANGTLPSELEEIRARLGDLLPQPEQEDDADEISDVPPLPDPVQELINSDLAAQAGTWIDEYVAYAANVSPMTPVSFHESAALWLVSSSVARRVVLKMAFDHIYPNLWFAWVAPSTLFGKSTSMNLARRIALQAFPHLLTAEDMTPEGLIGDMSGREPNNLAQMTLQEQTAWQDRRDFAGQRAWTMDEFSGLLASAGRDYNAGLIETLMRFYDCTDKYSRLTAGRGMQTIKHSYLTLLSASTPTALTQHLMSERLWSMGWWPRFALLAPESNRPAWQEPKAQPPPDKLIDQIRTIYKRLPEPTWPEPTPDIPARLVGDSYRIWNRYNKALRYELLDSDCLDQRFWAAYGRMPVHALKVSMILAILDWPEGDDLPPVYPRHVMRGIQIVEGWRQSAHRVLDLASNQAENKLQQRIIQLITKNPGGLTLRDIYKRMKRTRPKKIEGMLDDLTLRGELRQIDYQNPRGGPKTQKYVVG